MICREQCSGIRYRVWIVRYEGVRPAGWHEVPPGAVAVAPAERGAMSARRARHYVEAFNRAALGGCGKVWAVAVPVTVRYEGDPRPGGGLAGISHHEEIEIGQPCATASQKQCQT